jgi:hypothetical protein
MTNDDIKELIAELKELRLRELRVLDSIERTLQQNDNTNNINPNIVSGYVNPTVNAVAVPDQARGTNVYKEGDRVVITNSITRPLNRAMNRGDRTAVVTHIVGNRIYIRTSNNTKTWRAPQNLRFRTNDE